MHILYSCWSIDCPLYDYHMVVRQAQGIRSIDLVTSFSMGLPPIILKRLSPVLTCFTIVNKVW